MFKNSIGITGKTAEEELDAVNITVNKNSIPFDEETAGTTSGIRVGTAAMTSRGFNEDDFRRVGKWISEVLHHPGDEALKASIKEQVHALTSAHPYE